MSNAPMRPAVVGPLEPSVGRLGPEPPPADLRCCANCAHWHKKEYIHCQCSGPWGGNIFGDKNCTFRARKVRSNALLCSLAMKDSNDLHE